MVTEYIQTRGVDLYRNQKDAKVLDLQASSTTQVENAGRLTQQSSSKRDGKILPFIPFLNHESIVRKLVNKVDLPDRPCVLANGTELVSGTYFKEFCDTLVCSDGKILRPPIKNYAKICPDDYSIEPGLGCVKYVKENVTWCEARRRCRDMGADLVSLDGDTLLTNHIPFKNFQTAACVLLNGTKLKSGTFYKEFCDTLVCSDGKILRPPIPDYVKNCPNDFTIEPGLGCVKYVREEVTWCEARRRCRDIGADLVSLDGDTLLTSHIPFKNYQLGASTRNQQAWVGLTRTTSALWHWTIGGGITHFESPIWTGPDPNGPGQWQCVRTVTGSHDYKLGDRLCDDPNQPDGGSFNYICEVPGFG